MQDLDITSASRTHTEFAASPLIPTLWRGAFSRWIRVQDADREGDKDKALALPHTLTAGVHVPWLLSAPRPR